MKRSDFYPSVLEGDFYPISKPVPVVSNDHHGQGLIVQSMDGRYHGVMIFYPRIDSVSAVATIVTE